ncbi:hypothetical protein RB195_010872 [Necator americanus]|uniref:Uncharacterized protein n=1 Tax=Necator americanus TaxID=51031 RepID=A0ABR1D0V6_NECAM
MSVKLTTIFRILICEFYGHYGQRGHVNQDILPQISATYGPCTCSDLFSFLTAKRSYKVYVNDLLRSPSVAEGHIPARFQKTVKKTERKGEHSFIKEVSSATRSGEERGRELQKYTGFVNAP